MNSIREIQRLNQRELDSGIPLSASWHSDWADTAYVYIGGLPYELSEGDIVTIFSQYGEPVDVNLIRDKDTGKSKGFAFLKYEDQRSTALAVDNLGGSIILGRSIRVDHSRYKPKEGDNAGFDRSVLSAGEQDYKSRKRSRSVDRASPTPDSFLPEEVELQKMIQDYNVDDPMKDYLIEEKTAAVEAARKHKDKDSRDSAKSKPRHSRDEGSNHRFHRHKSNSLNERKRRHRSESHQITGAQTIKHETFRKNRESDQGKNCNTRHISEHTKYRSQS